MMKVLFEREAAGETVLDHDFIAEHTSGFDALKADIQAQPWPDLVAASGIEEAQIRRCAEIYIRSNATIICYGMRSEEHTSDIQSLMRTPFADFRLKKQI